MEADRVFVELRRAKNALAHRRFDHRRTHNIYPDTISRIFKRSGLGQSDYSMFACNIRCGPRRTHQARNRRHVDDGSATALLEHLPKFVL